MHNVLESLRAKKITLVLATSWNHEGKYIVEPLCQDHNFPARGIPRFVAKKFNKTSMFNGDVSEKVT